MRIDNRRGEPIAVALVLDDSPSVVVVFVAIHPVGLSYQHARFLKVVAVATLHEARIDRVEDGTRPPRVAVAARVAVD